MNECDFVYFASAIRTARQFAKKFDADHNTKVAEELWKIYRLVKGVCDDDKRVSGISQAKA